MPYVEWRGKKCRVRWKTGKTLPNGKPEYDSKSGFTDEDEAYTYGLDRESDVRNDRYISRRDGSVLMRDYCREWLDALDVGHLTERNYRSYVANHIEPRWGDTAVGDITAIAYRAWQKQLRATLNIGPAYANNIFMLFAMLMDDAVDDGMRPTSPVQRKRRRGKYTKKVREKKAHMRIEAVHQLALNALTYWGSPGYAFVLTMAFTGMRPAELYALRREYCHPAWPASDPDEDQRAESVERYAGEDPMPAIQVQHQHQWKAGALTLLPPKYESYRTLVIPPFLAELLEMLLDGHDSEWAFPSITGGELAKANFTYTYWRKIADGRPATVAGRGTRRPLPEIPAVPSYKGKRLYLLRHGHKEWIDEDGHSRIATEGRMGHEVAGVEGIYSQVTPAMERRIMEALQARWVRFLRQMGSDFPLPSPTSLPVDLGEWMKKQVAAALAMDSVIGS